MKNLRQFSVALAATIFMATAAQAQSKPVGYEYGMHLDVDKVLAIEVPRYPECSIVQAKMKYLDSTGERKSVAYRALSTCPNSN